LRCALMSPSIRYISRVRSLLGFASDAKSYVPSGFPSSPTWQYVHRTPRARVNPFITAESFVAGKPSGNALGFFIFSGHFQLSWAREGTAAEARSARASVHRRAR